MASSIPSVHLSLTRPVALSELEIPQPLPFTTEDFLVSAKSNPLLLLLPCSLEGLYPHHRNSALPVFYFDLLSPRHCKAPIILQTCLATVRAAQPCSLGSGQLRRACTAGGAWGCAAHRSWGCSTSVVQLQPAKLPLDSEVTTGTSRCSQPPRQGWGSPFGKLRDCFAEQGSGRPCSQPQPGHGC